MKNDRQSRETGLSYESPLNFARIIFSFFYTRLWFYPGGVEISLRMAGIKLGEHRFTLTNTFSFILDDLRPFYS